MIRIFFLWILVHEATSFDQQLVRTFVQSKYVKEFNLFISSSDQIDQWVSLRKTKNNLDSKYDYFADLKLNNQTLGYLINKFKIDFEYLKKKDNELIDNRSKRSIKSGTVGRYVTYKQICQWMLTIAKKNRDIVRLVKIGKSFENRSIYALKISEKSRKWQSKPLFLFDGGIHAREWLSVATSIYLIDKFINEYRANDANIVRILRNFELHFVPLLNPDGYEFSRSSKLNRFWRKNMRQSSNGFDHTCYGVDLNRNFDHKWMVSGASANPCSEIYAGRSGASEPEIKSFQDYIMSKSPRWLSHISMHAYGAIWLAPFSYTRYRLADNFVETCQKALTAIYTIEKKHGFSYNFGIASHELYEASGCSEDWAKEVAKVNHTFVIELKPDVTDISGFGFEYPEDKIEQASQEIFDGFLEYFKTFLGAEIDGKIVNECNNRMDWIKNIFENQ